MCVCQSVYRCVYVCACLLTQRQGFKCVAVAGIIVAHALQVLSSVALLAYLMLHLAYFNISLLFNFDLKESQYITFVYVHDPTYLLFLFGYSTLCSTLKILTTLTLLVRIFLILSVCDKVVWHCCGGVMKCIYNKWIYDSIPCT